MSGCDVARERVVLQPVDQRRVAPAVVVGHARSWSRSPGRWSARRRKQAAGEPPRTHAPPGDRPRRGPIGRSWCDPPAPQRRPRRRDAMTTTSADDDGAVPDPAGRARGDRAGIRTQSPSGIVSTPIQRPRGIEQTAQRDAREQAQGEARARRSPRTASIRQRATEGTPGVSRRRASTTTDRPARALVAAPGAQALAQLRVVQHLGERPRPRGGGRATEQQHRLRPSSRRRRRRRRRRPARRRAWPRRSARRSPRDGTSRRRRRSRR